MKKSISILALLAIIATGAFAQGISMAVGGGALFDYSLNNGMKKNDRYAGFQNLSFGGFGFLDVAYAELDVSFAYGSLTFVTDVPGNKNTEKAGSFLQLGFSLLGKYPIDLGSFTFSPLLGADYNMVLSYKDEYGKSFDKPGDYSQLGILAGVGLDFPLSGALFFRGEALFHLRFPCKGMDDGAASIGADATFGMGPRIKIGIGYMF